jgi:hypothetical protein
VRGGCYLCRSVGASALRLMPDAWPVEGLGIRRDWVEWNERHQASPVLMDWRPLRNAAVKAVEAPTKESAVGSKGEEVVARVVGGGFRSVGLI